MRLYPVGRLYREMAFIAYYFHWERDAVMSLGHAERVRWCNEISEIHKEQDGGDTFGHGINGG